MGILATDGYGQGLLPTRGYGSAGAGVEPIPSERLPQGVQIPAPLHNNANVNYSYTCRPYGHRHRKFQLLIDGFAEIQKRYRTEHFNIVASYVNQYEAFHEPGAEYKFSDLTAYYPFDGDTTAEKLEDKSGKGHDLTLIGGANQPTFVDGQYGTALLPKKIGSSMAYTDDCLYPNISGGFTAMFVSGWIALPLESSVEINNELMIYQNYNGTTNFKIEITPAGRIKVTIDDGTNYLIWYTEQPYLTTSYIQHFVVTYRKSLLVNGETGIPIIRVFVDGQERLTSLFVSDSGAPRELVYGGSTKIGTESGVLIDELRIGGHDLTLSDVITDYRHRHNLIEFDNFPGTALSSEWDYSGIVTVADGIALLSNGALIVTNDRVRTKEFNLATQLYVDARLGSGGGGDGELIATLKDGTTEIYFKIVVQYSAGDGQFKPVLKVGYKYVDGSSTTFEKTLDIAFDAFSDKEYRFVLYLDRVFRGINYSLAYYERNDVVSGTPVWTEIIAKTSIYSATVTGDYAFAFQLEHNTLNSNIPMGTSQYEVRSRNNILKYSPITT